MNTLKTDLSHFDNLINNGYSLTIKEYFTQGWELFQKDIPKFVGYIALYLVLQFVASGILRTAGDIIVSLIGGVWMAGYFIIAKKIQCQETYEFKDFFDGFKIFLPLFLVSLVGGLLVGLGFILLIVPGVYLAVSYTFAQLLVLFHGLEFWDALETSRKIVAKNWMQVFLFLLAIVGINILGAIPLGLGLLVTIPLSLFAVFFAFEHIMSQA